MLYKVNSFLKHDGEVYKPGSEIELDAKVAKPLVMDGVLSDPNAKDESDAPTPQPSRSKEQKKAEKEAKAKAEKEAKEKAEKEAAGNDDDKDNDGAGNDDDAPKTVSRETTQEDLDADPTLVEQGVQVGDVREFPVEETNGDDL